MSITSLTASPLGATGWRLVWASDAVDPTYSVYRDGVLIHTTDLTAYTVPGIDGSLYEVFDDNTEPSAGFPPYIVLAWYASSGATSYLVQQYVSAAWATVATISAGSDTYFRWESGTLNDDTVHQFRVVPVGANGNSGTAQTFNTLMVRRPTPPAAEYVYNGSGTPTVTISEA